MSLQCSECKEAAYEAVDRETDVQGHSYVLLKCRKCERSVIVPEKDWRPDASREKAAKG